MEQKVEKKKYGVVVKDSDQIGQLSKFCLIDFFFFLCFIFSGACQLLWGENCALMSFIEEGKIKRQLKGF